MFILYKTTNKINGKFYIGVHNSKRPWYKGSGSYLKKAIEKYGLDNFERQTLFEFETANDAYAKEKEIVNYDLVSDPQCYNLRLGGRGGKSGVTTVKDALTNEYIGAVQTTHPNVINGKWVHILKGRDTFAKARVKSIQARKGKPGHRRGVVLTEDTKQKIRNALLGTKQSEETKEKRSAAMRGRTYEETIICPHCKTEGRSNAMKRWHFDRCKQSS